VVRSAEEAKDFLLGPIGERLALDDGVCQPLSLGRQLRALGIRSLPGTGEEPKASAVEAGRGVVLGRNLAHGPKDLAVLTAKVFHAPLAI
ncbi:MAG: hypothetical protein M3133_06700, partial [Actinomycetota bacterium]|nr:hypothetical protein [Actinomycetota bacterium]